MGPFIIILKVILLNKLTHYAKLKFQSIIIMVALTNKMSNSCMRLRLFMIACVIATGLAKCRCHGTFEVCEKSGKSAETCDAFHWGRSHVPSYISTAAARLMGCALIRCYDCDRTNLHFDPRKGEEFWHCAVVSNNGVIAEHVTQNDPDLPGFNSSYGAGLFAGAPISRDGTVAIFKFRVDRPGGYLAIGLREPNYYYDSEGNMHDGKLTTGLPKFRKGSHITVSLGAGELIYSHNGEEVHRSVLPELPEKWENSYTDNARLVCGKFQLCVKLEDAKVTLLGAWIDGIVGDRWASSPGVKHLYPGPSDSAWSRMSSAVWSRMRRSS